MIARLVHPHLEHASHLHLFFQQRIMIFLEQSQEFIGISPLRLVVVLDDEGLARRGGRTLRPTHHRINSEQDQQECEAFHGKLLSCDFQIVDFRL